MAVIIEVKQHDTITGILKSRKGVTGPVVFQWLEKMRKLNPHIKNPDRIFPGDRLLVPDTLHEQVGLALVWENALGQMPGQIKVRPPIIVDIPAVVATSSDTVDSLAEHMFESSPNAMMPHRVKRAILLWNNPRLMYSLNVDSLKPGTFVNLCRFKLTEAEVRHWQEVYLALEQQIRDMKDLYRYDKYGPANPGMLLQLAELLKPLKEAGASIGMDEVLTGTGYGVAGVSAHSASGLMAVSSVNALSKELFEEAVKKFGEKVVCSKKATHLARVQRFLTSHPNYIRLQKHLADLPRHLLPKGKLLPTPASLTNFADARYFRRQFTLPHLNHSTGRTVHNLARGLKGRVSLLKGAGTGATWVLPAVIGGVNVARAPQHLKMRTLFEEGFGVVGGAIGTAVGAKVIGAVVVSAFCLGPLGAFIVVAVCAAAGGIALMEGGRRFGSGVYEYNKALKNGRIFNSMEQFIGNILQ